MLFLSILLTSSNAHGRMANIGTCHIPLENSQMHHAHSIHQVHFVAALLLTSNTPDVCTRIHCDSCFAACEFDYGSG